MWYRRTPRSVSHPVCSELLYIFPHIAMVIAWLWARLVVCVLLKAPGLFLHSRRNSTFDNLDNYDTNEKGWTFLLLLLCVLIWLVVDKDVNCYVISSTFAEDALSVANHKINSAYLNFVHPRPMESSECNLKSDPNRVAAVSHLYFIRVREEPYSRPNNYLLTWGGNVCVSTISWYRK